MPYRRTGRSGLKLPAISLGLWQNFGDDKPLDTQRAILRRALRRRPPFEVHIPRLKTKLARFVDIFPFAGPWFAPFYQWTGRRRMAQRRAAK